MHVTSFPLLCNLLIHARGMFFLMFEIMVQCTYIDIYFNSSAPGVLSQSFADVSSSLRARSTLQKLLTQKNFQPEVSGVWHYSQVTRIYAD